MSGDLKSKPLSGILVVDFTHVLSGPFCTMMLADQGARVIKIEKAGTGDDSRAFGPFYEDNSSVYFEFVNRGKESITLNLKDADDLSLVKKMISRADVVVENFRPGTMERLGLAPDDLLKQYPSLIVCSISGFGQTGPMKLEPAYDTVVQALSGLMSVTGFPDGKPTRVGTSISDLTAGLFAYAAVTTALVGRQRTGKGTTIDVAMLDGTFTLLEHGLMDALAEHIDPTRIGNAHPSIAPFDAFQCADRMLAICCGNDQLFGKMCDALGLTAAKTDSRYTTNDKRMQNQESLKESIEAVLKTQPAKVWSAKLQESGIPAGLVQTVTEAEQMQQIIERDMIVTIGKRQFPGNPIKFGGFDSSCADTPPPALGSDNDKIRNYFKQ
ncbi:MAG: CoA:oxalate CoA-transferase [Thermodesulfobacteriota bacterium]|nr:CoA:oxalate CoA-transferase [Thermodesulfobacteriota bacterium]